MVERHEVETGSPEMSAFLLKLASEHGWEGVPPAGELRPWIVIHSLGDASSVCWSFRSNGYTELSIIQAVEMLKKGPVLPVRIAGHTVHFGKSGISWGETTLSTAAIDEIHKRLHAEDEI